jgi:hypothetical protein
VECHLEKRQVLSLLECHRVSLHRWGPPWRLQYYADELGMPVIAGSH